MLGQLTLLWLTASTVVTGREALPFIDDDFARAQTSTKTGT